MRILAIADTEENWLLDRHSYAGERLRGLDLIISCGDLPASYLEHIVTLANVPLLYVRGNHDTAYEQHAPEGCVSIDGKIRAFQGLRIMGLGGSLRYNDRVYGFTESEMFRRAARLGLFAHAAGGIDLLVTHAPARGYGDLEDLPHRGFEALNTLLEQLKPTYMLHGHIHMEYGRIERARTHACGTRILNVCGAQVIDIPDDELPVRSRRLLFPVEEI